MSDAAEAAPVPSWPILDLQERRVLGVLVEKAKTTPDVYPMSINSLVAGSNQKSNRDPILNLSEVDVEDALARCQKKGLTTRITGSSRVERWKHDLYEAWTHDKVELAILAELLLRGPQTEGELRGRASRMEPIDDLDRLRAVLKPMVERKLIVYLTAEERRGAMLTHGFHDPAELAHLRRKEAAAVPTSVMPHVPSPAPVPIAPANEDRVKALTQELAAVKQQVAVLEGQVRTLQGEVVALRQSLGG